MKRALQYIPKSIVPADAMKNCSMDRLRSFRKSDEVVGKKNLLEKANSIRKFLLPVKALVVVVVMLLAFTGTVFGQGWYNTSWLYRKSHSIGSATGAGTNYQVPITVYYGSGTDGAGSVYTTSKCRTDFGDIRFTSSDGTTLLDYWIQSSTTSNNAVFWVEVAADLGSTQAIYVY